MKEAAGGHYKDPTVLRDYAIPGCFQTSTGTSPQPSRSALTRQVIQYVDTQSEGYGDTIAR